MKNETSRTITGLFVAVIALDFSPGAFAEVKEHPYQFIVARNPFALRPTLPPPKDEPLPAPAVPPLEIKLTGLSTLLGRALVFLEFTDPQTRRTDRPAPMSEGEMYQGTIAIVAIDAEHSRVTVRNGGVERTLDFEKDGLKPPPPSAPPPVPPTHASFPPTPVPPAPPAMSRVEVEERITRMREFYQQQNHPAANILPPGRSGLPNLPSPSRGLR